MQIHKRWIQLCGDHTVADPYFDRVVYVNDHVICFTEYASGREECSLNGTVIAVDSIDDINRELGSAKAMEMFEDLTGVTPREWDRLYRRTCWREWMSTRRHWWLDVSFPSERDVCKLNAKHLRYEVGEEARASALRLRERGQSWNELYRSDFLTLRQIDALKQG